MFCMKVVSILFNERQTKAKSLQNWSRHSLSSKELKILIVLESTVRRDSSEMCCVSATAQSPQSFNSMEHNDISWNIINTINKTTPKRLAGFTLNLKRAGWS